MSPVKEMLKIRLVSARPTRPKHGKGLKPGGSTAVTQRPAASRTKSFPIVGIGASAGGLEALEPFLENVPANNGMAFVIIQHLDPTHQGIMPELLQRKTGMKVVQVRDRTVVKPECVYVIPPNKDMSILHGVLHLLAPTAPRGLHLPIDFFLRSLAMDRESRSVGVILSGMGSDGTLGLRAIKEHAGLVLVQEPTTAKFDGMPRSAIDAGLADIVAPVEELPGRIIAYLQYTPLTPRKEEVLEDRTQSAVQKAVILLRSHTGHDFSQYKSNTLHRRIERRMGIHQITRLSAYIRYLQENSQELDFLFKELLIGVTNFFRDPILWKKLATEVLPALLADRPAGHSLRAWIPGCSTGEEAYSLAMVFQEAAERIKAKGNVTLQIFATDLDPDAIERARQGLFPPNIVADVSAERLERFFIQEERGYRICKAIRERVIFASQDLIMDPPFTKLDILSCRNLLIYLTAEVQKKLIPLFHYSLVPGGILILGGAETTAGATDLFTPVGGDHTRIFRRTQPLTRAAPVSFPPAFELRPRDGRELPSAPKVAANLQTLADQLILQRYAPPAVLVNHKGDIFYVSGHTAKYLEPAAGKANWNLFVMARETLRYELAAGFQKALRQKERILLPGLRILADTTEQRVDVTIQQLDSPGALLGLVMIVFTEVPTTAPPPVRRRVGPPGPDRTRVIELEEDLLQIRTEANVVHAEMQALQEESRSANEELQSTNEELQSTNEELMTSKEEMQSLNEELQTVNAELQGKVEELSRASNDMRNLLDSTDIATLFLDRDLNVRRFTPQATQIIKLITADEGRPITDLACELHYPELATDARKVLRTLTSVEKPIAASEGRWFSVRIMPYRTADDRIDGVVMTFANITVAKTLETKLRGQQASLEKNVAEKTGDLARTRRRLAAKDVKAKRAPARGKPQSSPRP